VLHRTRLQPFPSVCSSVKPIGKPDAGNRPVRFDERGQETERCRMAQATAPLFDSTKKSAMRRDQGGRCCTSEGFFLRVRTNTAESVRLVVVASIENSSVALCR